MVLDQPMLTLSNSRLKFGRLPCDPPLRLWGPILLWQLLCWPVAALGTAIRRSGATGSDQRLTARRLAARHRQAKQASQGQV